MKSCKHLQVALALSLLSCSTVWSKAPGSPVPPRVWMMPPIVSETDGRILREMFAHPDQWSETRKKIDVLGYSDLWLNKQFSDDELKTWLPMLEKWGIKLGLEVGAVKPWGQTGKEAFDRGTLLWDRFQRLGGKIGAITMDEPLYCCRYDIKKPDAYAVEQTADFIALVRQKYPDIAIEETEPYPSISVADHIAWIDALQARLKQMNVRGLDSYRVDVNWSNFTCEDLPGNCPMPGNWVGVKRIETACRERKIPFNLIYWASDEPNLQRMGLAGESTWYLDIMWQGDAYALVGGAPDTYCIESWINVPLAAVPETEQWTFSRSVLDFCNRFIKREK